MIQLGTIVLTCDDDATVSYFVPSSCYGFRKLLEIPSVGSL
jgi:hypothetical protein